MDVIQTSNRQVDKFGAGVHGFQAGVPGVSLATQLSPSWCDGVQQEPVNVIRDSGIVLSGATLTQLRDALRRIYGGNVTVCAAGATNLTADAAGCVFADASAGAVAINLPATDAVNSRPYPVEIVRIDTSANAVTVNRAGTNVFLGGATSIGVAVGQVIRLRANGGVGGAGFWFSADLAQEVGRLEVYAGATVAPQGTVKANGTLLTRVGFPALFAYASAQGLVTEAVWSAGSQGRYSVGDGATTFRVPDLRGEFLRMWDDGRGVDSGRAIGSQQADSFASHNHTIKRVPLGAAAGGTGTVIGADNSRDSTNYVAAYGDGTGPVNVAGGTETRPRNIAALAVIRF